MTSMIPYSSAIQTFMDTFDQPCYPVIESVPCDVALLRGKLIEEETNEYGLADIASIEELDALCDLLYVTVGTNLSLNIPIYHPDVSKLIPAKTPEKWHLFSTVREAVQDLKCRFPCHKTQTRALNKIILEIFRVAKNVGYDFEPAFNEVHRSNMTKLWTVEFLPTGGEFTITSKPNGYVVKNKAGKVLKPPTFTPPNLEPYLPKNS